MNSPLVDFKSYSVFIYTLPEQHSFIINSTLALAAIGATLAKLEGKIQCQNGMHLEVWELIDFESHRIRAYSYEIFHRGEKISWYDHWEHPEFPRSPLHFRTTNMCCPIFGKIVCPRLA